MSDKRVKPHLSFAALYRFLPPRVHGNVPAVEDEPSDLISERLATSKNGHAQKTYRFELSSYEPDLLLTAVSKLFPQLTFILGWVAPNVDEAASKFLRNGVVKKYNLPDDRRGEIRANKYKEWGEDSLDADWEADWEMLDEVVKHWDKVSTGLRRKKSKGRGVRMRH